MELQKEIENGGIKELKEEEPQVEMEKEREELVEVVGGVVTNKMEPEMKENGTHVVELKEEEKEIKSPLEKMDISFYESNLDRIIKAQSVARMRLARIQTKKLGKRKTFPYLLQNISV